MDGEMGLKKFQIRGAPLDSEGKFNAVHYLNEKKTEYKIHEDFLALMNNENNSTLKLTDVTVLWINDLQDGHAGFANPITIKLFDSNGNPLPVTNEENRTGNNVILSAVDYLNNTKQRYALAHELVHVIGNLGHDKREENLMFVDPIRNPSLLHGHKRISKGDEGNIRNNPFYK